MLLLYEVAPQLRGKRVTHQHTPRGRSRHTNTATHLSVFQELHDDPDGIVLDDSDETHDVGMVQVFHQVCARRSSSGEERKDLQAS